MLLPLTSATQTGSAAATEPPGGLGSLDGLAYAAAVIALAVAAHFLVRLAADLLRRIVGAGAHRTDMRRTHPKLATLTSLVTSAAIFAIYFLAIGLVLREFEIDLTAYVATASVIALAVGFGSQGLVQDVVIGTTLVFSDACDVGDVVEISGQIGRVDRIGLRFTTLVNALGQTVYIPNRNIAVVGRYRGGVVRAYADIQLPASGPQGAAAPETEIVALVRAHAQALRAQHGAIVLSDPEVSEVRTNEDGGWRYVRVKFRIWPGQGALIEQTFRPRLAAALRTIDPAYADWMIPVTYRAL